MHAPFMRAKPALGCDRTHKEEPMVRTTMNVATRYFPDILCPCPPIHPP